MNDRVISAATAVARRTGVEWVELDGDVVIDDRAGAALTTLNRSAASIWMQCDGSRDAAAVARVLQSEFSGLPDDVLGEVLAALSDFVERGLAEVVSGGSGGSR